MSAPKEALSAMRDDAHVLAVLAAVEGAPITDGVIVSLAKWFHDVEIVYPIAEMAIDAETKRQFASTIATELTEHFDAAYRASEAGTFDDEAFTTLAATVDPLWRELAGLFAKELNESFESNRVDADQTGEAIQEMLNLIERMHGEDGVSEFRMRSKTDKSLRAQLRRMGLDPDKL